MADDSVDAGISHQDPPNPGTDLVGDKENSTPNQNGTGNDSSAAGGGAGQQPRKRPKLDLNVSEGRKRGKSMFGLLVGTLNKAKAEDKMRNATDAAKKRQLIDQRLQAKIAKDTEVVRRQEEAKKERVQANRKEEDLALKDSIHAARQRRLTHLSSFLSTADDIRACESDDEGDSSVNMDEDEDAEGERDEEMDQPTDDTRPKRGSKKKSKPKPDPLRLPPRQHPPHIFYLPAILLPSQKAFIDRRKAEVTEALAAESDTWTTERQKLVEEIAHLRQKAEEDEKRIQAEKEAATGALSAPLTAEKDVEMAVEDANLDGGDKKDSGERERARAREREREEEENAVSASIVDSGSRMDEDDAVEY